MAAGRDGTVSAIYFATLSSIVTPGVTEGVLLAAQTMQTAVRRWLGRFYLRELKERRRLAT